MKKIIGVIGVGYVGMPLINELAKSTLVIAYDIDEDKIYKLSLENKEKNIKFTSEESELKKCDVIIVAVPTPTINNMPDLSCVENACVTVGRNIKNGALIIFESSYMPGTTQKICIPLIEKNSNKTYNKDFFVGYSPERINPGDRIHTLNTITKIVSADNNKTLKKVIDIYSLIENIKLKPVNDMKIAELSKMVENTQRDINIAFVNEIAKLCHKIGVDTNDVIEAAATKWNFYKVTPGFVGGHCIGVDPYYLIDIAEQNGVSLDVTKNARKTNENMSNFIVDSLLSLLPKEIKNINIGILGYSYKANSDDIRNTKTNDLIKELKKITPNVKISDYIVSKKINTLCNDKLNNLDVLIVTVDHDLYKNYTLEQLRSFFNENSKIKILMDLKSIYNKYNFDNDIIYWKL